MVEPLQREAVEVGEIAGDVQLRDLPLATRQILAAAIQPSSSSKLELSSCPLRMRI